MGNDRLACPVLPALLQVVWFSENMVSIFIISDLLRAEKVGHKRPKQTHGRLLWDRQPGEGTASLAELCCCFVALLCSESGFSSVLPEAGGLHGIK